MTERANSAAAGWTVEKGDRTEIRIATVMTGGVSLAVWMGGVGYELHQLTDPAELGSPYTRLCDLFGTTASIDVISGSSAGGINGALLALATAHPSRLDFVREMWLNEGSLEQLLRAPTEPAPRSLLQGDEQFLPALRRAFASVPRRSEPATDITLLITTTLLQGESRSGTDDFGTVVRDIDHHGTFRFGKDDFKDPDIAVLLAKAARCSASFPAAFEASFCRVEPDVTGAPSVDNPNMAGIVDSTISRFTVDGGLLNNKPIGPALRAIFDRPPERPVRRVLLYIVPDPGASTYGEAERADEPPTLGRVLLSSLIEIPTAQSIAADLADLRRHNHRIEQQRYLREELLHTGLVAGTIDQQQYQRYRELRAEAAADEFLQEFTLQVNGRVAAGTLPMAWRAAYEFNSEAYRRRRIGLIAADYQRLPSSVPEPGGPAFEQFGRLGREAVARGAYAVLDLADRATAVCHSSELREQRTLLLQVSKDLHDTLGALRQDSGSASLRETLRKQLDEVDVNSRDDLNNWAVLRFSEWMRRPAANNLDDHLRTVCLRARRVEQVMTAITRWYERHPDSAPASSREQVRRVGAAVRALVGDDPTALEDNELVRRLLILEVLQIVLAVDRMVLEHPVELMQVSAESRNGLTYHRLPAEKLTGLQLNHFGAFYKRSWRSNDWLWGRIDAAGWITYLLMQPKRLRQLKDLFASRYPSASFLDMLLDRLRAIAVGHDVLRPGEEEYLTRLWENDESEIRKELAFLKDPAISQRPQEDTERLPDPSSLPITSIAVARGLQYAILLEELPKLRDDTEIDVEQGAGGRDTVPWRRRFDRVWSTGGDLRPDTVVALFRDSPLPRERLGGEVGTDLFTYAASTAAATGLKAGTLAVPSAKILVAPLAVARGIGVVLFFLSRWMLYASKFGFAAVTAAVAVGLLLLFSASAWAKSAGTVLVGAVVVIAALRTWRWSRTRSPNLKRAGAAVGIAVAALFVLFLVLAPWLPRPADNAPADGIRAAGDWLVTHPVAYAALAAVVVLVVLGSIPLPHQRERHSPVRALRDALESHARDIGLQLDLLIESSVVRHLAGHLSSIRRGGKTFLSALRDSEATYARVTVSSAPGLSQFDAEYDGGRIEHLSLSRLLRRNKRYDVNDESLNAGLRRISVQLPLDGSQAPPSGGPLGAPTSTGPVGLPRTERR